MRQTYSRVGKFTATIRVLIDIKRGLWNHTRLEFFFRTRRGYAIGYADFIGKEYKHHIKAGESIDVMVTLLNKVYLTYDEKFKMRRGFPIVAIGIVNEFIEVNEDEQ